MKSLGLAIGIVAFATFQAIGQPKYTNNRPSSLSIESTKGTSTIDPNYKHQAGNNKTETDAATVTTEETTAYDANYKHQAGRRREGRKNALIVKEAPSRHRTDANYKHQFPSN